MSTPGERASIRLRGQPVMQEARRGMNSMMDQVRPELTHM